MKSIFFIPFLFLFTLFCSGQSNEIKIDYDFFILGTLNDYMGRQKHEKITNRVDEYWENDKSLVFFLDFVSSNKYQDLTITKNKTSGRLELKSKLLAQKINNFYIYKPTSNSAYNGEADFNKLNFDSLMKTPNYHTIHFDKIYKGEINESIFKNKTQKSSFIAGAFERFGGKKDSLYYISVANSASKVRVATELLKELKCTNVEYVITNYIPCGHTVYFTPTEELKIYFKSINKMLNAYAIKSKE